MAIDFPASPTLNDVFTVGNVTYVWDGTKWTASVTGGISLDKIEEGNTSAEVIDTGSDGRFVVTTEGTERLRVTNTGLCRDMATCGRQTLALKPLTDLSTQIGRHRLYSQRTGQATRTVGSILFGGTTGTSLIAVHHDQSRDDTDSSTPERPNSVRIDSQRRRHWD
jgi:hypothetical protein